MDGNAAFQKKKMAQHGRLRVITRSRRTGTEYEKLSLFVPETFRIEWRYLFDDMAPGEIIKFVHCLTCPKKYAGISKSSWKHLEIEFLQRAIKNNYLKKDISKVLGALESYLHGAAQRTDHQKTRHHLTPKVRGGKNGNSKVIRLPKRFHGAWHYVFGHLLPDEVIKFVRVFLQGKGLHKLKRRWSKDEILALRSIIQQNSMREVTEKIKALFSQK